MLSTKTDIGVNRAMTPMMASEIAMARTPTMSGSESGDQCAEGEDQDDEGEREESFLSLGAVSGDDGAHVEVERRPPRDSRLEPRRLRQTREGPLHQFAPVPQALRRYHP